MQDGGSGSRRLSGSGIRHPAYPVSRLRDSAACYLTGHLANGNCHTSIEVHRADADPAEPRAAVRARCGHRARGTGGRDRLREVLPARAAAVLRIRRGALPLRLGGDGGTGGRALLDLARAAAHLPGSPPASRRLGRARGAGPCRPRDANRPLEGDDRVPARGHQLRDVPHGERAAAARTRPTIYPAAPSHQTAPQQYVRFLFACASDPRFTADTILAEIAKNHQLSLLDRLIYRFVLIPRTRQALLDLQTADAWMPRAPMGARAHRPIQPGQVPRAGQPVDATIGNSDMVPLWNLAAHADTRSTGTG